MKLTTIKNAINQWNETNDYYDSAQSLLNQGLIFKLDQNLTKMDIGNSTAPSLILQSIHAYVGVLENSIIFFLINNVMDTKEAFDYQGNDKITNYIFNAPLHKLNPDLLAAFTSASSISWEEVCGVADTPTSIPSFEGHRRVLQWTMSNYQWIRNQIDNVNGLFTAFTIPVKDLEQQTIENWYAILALRENKKNEKNLGNPYLADLIIWDSDNSKVIASTGEGDSLFDTVGTVPPFNLTDGTEKDKFHLFIANG